MKAVVWTIAGADSSSAAGVAVDMKVCQALGVHGAAVLTAVTAQGLQTFNASVPVSAAMIRAQIDALADLPRPAAVKIGMIPTAEAAKECAAFLADYRGAVIFDPVLSTTSGGCLATDAALDAVKSRLLPRIDLLTPNALEAERLTGCSVKTAIDVEHAATELIGQGVRAVLIKGGHVEGLTSSDYFRSAEGDQFWIHARTVAPAPVRGTGCALSTAVAVGAARGLPLDDAVVLAKAYVTRGIREAYLVGDGPKVLSHGDWPVTSDDMPWITPGPARERMVFPATGDEPLGFYPVVPSVAWVERLVALGVRTIQLRIKDTSPTLAADIAQAVRLTKDRGVRLFINDHWQEALAAKAYGVHLGQEDLATADLVAIAATGLRLGISTHSLREAARANALGPSYVALGPIFATTCKAMRFGPQGLGRIAEWRSLFKDPLVAIGGLKLAHVTDAMAQGANGVAVVSDVLDNADPDVRAKMWLAAAHSARKLDDDRLSQRPFSEA